jgi:hypothetical protein
VVAAIIALLSLAVAVVVDGDGVGRCGILLMIMMIIRVLVVVVAAVPDSIRRLACARVGLAPLIFRGAAASSSSSRGAHRRDGWREGVLGWGRLKIKLFDLRWNFLFSCLLLEASLSPMKPTKPASVSAQPTHWMNRGFPNKRGLEWQR